MPPACATKSLAGGYLMATRLREILVAGGAPRTGNDLAVAQGPVMIGNAKNPNDPKVGRVLGGGRVKKESPYMLIIKDKRKSIRTAQILERVVNERFHQSEAGHAKGGVHREDRQLSCAPGAAHLPPEPGALFPGGPALAHG